MSVRYKLGDNVFKRIWSFFFLFVFFAENPLRHHPYIRFCDCLYSCISVFVIVCICICQEGKKLCAAAIFASFEGKLRRKLSRLNSPCLHIRHTSSPSHWLNSPRSLCLHVHHTSSPSSYSSKGDDQFNYQHQSTMHWGRGNEKSLIKFISTQKNILDHSYFQYSWGRVKNSLSCSGKNIRKGLWFVFGR